VVGGFVSLLLVAACALFLLDVLSQRTERSVTLWPGVERVELDLGRGNVEIVPARGKGVRVEEERRSGIVSASSSRKLTGHRLKLHAGCRVVILDCSVNYRIQVPRGTAVDVKGLAGSITARDVDGNVRLVSTAGDVRAIAVRGRRVELKTSAGTAEAGGVVAPYVSVRSAAGNAIAELLAPPRDLFVETHAGDATATLPDVGYRIDAGTDAGDTKIRVRRDDRSRRIVRVRTNAGNATVRGLRAR
jgi:hypothetical protein